MLLLKAFILIKAFISRKYPIPANTWVESWRWARMEGRFQFGMGWSQFTCFYPKEELSIQFSCCWTGSVTNPDLASKISAIKTCLWCPAQYIKTKSMLLPRWMGEWFGLTSEQLQKSQAWRDLKNQLKHPLKPGFWFKFKRNENI